MGRGTDTRLLSEVVEQDMDRQVMVWDEMGIGTHECFLSEVVEAVKSNPRERPWRKGVNEDKPITKLNLFGKLFALTS